MIVNKKLVQKKMIENNWTKQEFCENTDICMPTLKRIMTSKSVKPTTVAKLTHNLEEPIEDLVDVWD